MIFTSRGDSRTGRLVQNLDQIHNYHINSTVVYVVVTTMININNKNLRINFIRNRNVSEFQYLMAAVFWKSIPFYLSRA